MGGCRNRMLIQKNNFNACKNSPLCERLSLVVLIDGTFLKDPTLDSWLQQGIGLRQKAVRKLS
jgi:hypothetical protein